MDEIRFVDTTLRDGHQSLWAERMTTGMMLPVAERIDNAGYEAIEILSGSHIKKSVRELREDPWERVRRVAKRITRTPLRVIAGRVNTFGFDPPVMYQLFLDRMAANGVRQGRISEPWNDLPGWTRRTDAVRKAGLEPIINLIYSVSPRHTDEYYARCTRDAVSLKVPRLCLKDPGGLLTPARMRTLVPTIFANAGGTPVELHSHCTTGLGPLNALEAMKLGIRTVNTAIPPLSDSASLPSVFNVARNARALGYAPRVDEDMIRPVSDHFMFVARHEGLPVGAPVEYDEAQYRHQIPGGMISNLGHQLALVGLADRFAEALEETVRVRADLGYPIMVTPLSQFVGSQAAINVILGERYREVSDQVIRYALGQYGAEGAEGMDQDVRARILDRPRTRDLAGWEEPDPSLTEMRRELGAGNVSDEELLLRWLLGPEEIAAMRAAGKATPYLSARQPLVALVAEIAKRTGFSQLRLQRPGFSLIMEKRAAPQG
jgi:oxaloacetate decarboxylase alpha subunit